MHNNARIAVIIPCYKVRDHVLKVIEKIPSYVDGIICIDDCCPEHSGSHIKKNCSDQRVTVLFNSSNTGVGGAVIRGYRHCMENGLFDVLVKIDGDNQMDPAGIEDLTAPIIAGCADYCKGNRFFSFSVIKIMPVTRLIGNLGLTMLCRMSSGYWSIKDSTNGYTAISSDMLKRINLDKISRGYFFESDMLCSLYFKQAAVKEIDMEAKYGNEKSNIIIFSAFFLFSIMHARRFTERIIRCYIIKTGRGTILLAFSVLLLAAALYCLARKVDMMITVTCSIISVLLICIFLKTDSYREPLKSGRSRMNQRS
jgi:glycosyltransferase involved in cell wall biosynthesis